MRGRLRIVASLWDTLLADLADCLVWPSILNLPSPPRIPGSQPFGTPLPTQPAVLQPSGQLPTSAQVTAQLAGMQIGGTVGPALPPLGLGFGE